MNIGWLYFIIIVLANAVGAVSGMGGGVIIKPALDLIGYDAVAAISFYSAVAVFTMSLVSTVRQVQSGRQFNWQHIGYLAVGSTLGGYGGNAVFELLLQYVSREQFVTLIQIILTIALLVFALLYAQYEWTPLMLHASYYYGVCGIVLGFMASLLGIGGGPINVALLMWWFAMPIKDATAYSICTIFCSQLTKLASIVVSTGFGRYDVTMLYFIVPAGIVGGLLGAKLTRLLTPAQVKRVFQVVIIGVILINLYNAWRIV